MNPLFQELNAVTKLNMTLSLSLLRTQLQFLQSDFKSEHFSRTCSVVTDLVTSINNPVQSTVLLSFVIMAIYGELPFSLISFSSAALLPAVLQENTEPFGNAFVKMKNQLVEMWNVVGTSIVPVQNVYKRSAVRSHAHL